MLYTKVSGRKNKNRSKKEIIKIISDEIEKVHKKGRECLSIINTYDRGDKLKDFDAHDKLIDEKGCTYFVPLWYDIIIPEIEYLPSVLEHFYEGGFKIRTYITKKGCYGNCRHIKYYDIYWENNNEFGSEDSSEEDSSEEDSSEEESDEEDTSLQAYLKTVPSKKKLQSYAERNREELSKLMKQHEVLAIYEKDNTFCTKGGSSHAELISILTNYNGILLTQRDFDI